MVYVPIVEAVANLLQAVGIRTKLRGLERASFQKSDQEKKLKLARVGSPAAGNAATRIEAFVVSTGTRRLDTEVVDLMDEPFRCIAGDKWITWRLTPTHFRLTKRRMQDADARALQIRILSGAAGHLCSALEALAHGDCDWYTRDLLEMLSAIDGQIAGLREIDSL
ncbi:MAG: hypothetical protein ACRELZ_19615 [Candidatus Rokuibacteriota bacterium]